MLAIGEERVGGSMTAYIVIGGVGLVLVLASLVLGEVLDGVFESIDLDIGGGLLSGPVIGSFLAAFGFGAALVMYATGAGAALGALAGLGSGIVVGGIAGLLTRSLMSMPTDATMRSSDLVGVPATVVTRIPAEGLGEVTLTHLGQYLKLSARAAEPLPAGTPVTVAAVVSSSSVLVERREPAGGDS